MQDGGFLLLFLGEVWARGFGELDRSVGLGTRASVYMVGTVVEYGQARKGGNERERGRTRLVAALRRMPATADGDAVPEAALSAA